MLDTIRKSAGAALMIALGSLVLLKVGQPLGPFLFALGLLAVCDLKLNLFTGKCGFWLEDKIPLQDLIVILVTNLVAGYIAGYAGGYLNNDLIAAAAEKVASWDMGIAFFIKSVFCGIVMYVAVKLYRNGTRLGILVGVPLFIFAGFQHCIANIITCGVAQTFSMTIIICVLGNFAGSLLCSFLTKE
ncbi:MAG: formate/nitrite transporter family protein [Erysipelotrichaceae bacterium]|nr:formate/nitrite transporter family protein [Erysipelotrichaceae bacterium]